MQKYVYEMKRFYRTGNVIVYKKKLLMPGCAVGTTNVHCNLKSQILFLIKRVLSRVKLYVDATQPSIFFTLSVYILTNGPRVYKSRERLPIRYCRENDVAKRRSTNFNDDTSPRLLVFLWIVQNFLSRRVAFTYPERKRKTKREKERRRRDIINKNDHLISIERIATFLHPEQHTTYDAPPTFRILSSRAHWIFTALLQYIYTRMHQSFRTVSYDMHSKMFYWKYI